MNLMRLAQLARLTAPARCPFCRAAVALDAPGLCRCCALTCPPLQARQVADLLDGAALCAGFRYGGALAEAIVHAKFRQGLPGLGDALAPWVATATALARSCEVDAWVAVAPQRRRLVERGWHLPDLLADTLAAAHGAPARRWLSRLDDAGPRALGPSTAPVFALAGPAARAGRLRGVTIALVDDIVTSGATLRVARRALEAAGARVPLLTVLADARPDQR